MSWRGWPSVGGDTKRKLTLRKRHFFVIDVKDVKQGQKIDPDLLE